MQGRWAVPDWLVRLNFMHIQD